MKANSKPLEYHKCHWKFREFIIAILQTVVVMCTISYFFYQSAWAMIPLTIYGVFYFLKLERKNIQRRKELLLAQFRECITSVSMLLRAGYSLENAFVECADGMKTMYGADSDIYKELSCIKRGMSINIAIEDLLFDFGDRSGCEDINQFGNIVSVAKRSAGNLTEIIENTIDQIGRKTEVQEEMKTILSGRRMELNVMKIVPFGILAYINLSAPGYLNAMYHNFAGVIIMTICLVAFVAATWLGERIMRKIEEALISS